MGSVVSLSGRLVARLKASMQFLGGKLGEPDVYSEGPRLPTEDTPRGRL